MLPKIIIHNAISVDGAINGFPLDLGQYYGITGQYEPGAMLVGSSTAKTGIETYGGSTPEEIESDFIMPRLREEDTRPYWVIPDSHGALQGLLHVFRRMEYCKDVVILVTEQTPEAYIKYLLERNYEIIIAGEEHVDFKSALEILNQRYGVKVVLTDSGGALNSILLKQGLADELSLVVTPFLVDNSHPKLFRELDNPDLVISLELIEAQPLENQLLLRYRIIR